MSASTIPSPSEASAVLPVRPDPAAKTQPASFASTLALPASPALASALPSLALPALAIVALAAAAIVLGRRRRAAPRLVEVVEQTSLGPKRALVVARLGDEVLLLGSSEAGISLLKAQPSLAAAPSARAPTSAAPPASPSRLATVVARLAPARRAPAPATAGFEDLLAESAEDQELRRKIAAGRAGSVR